MRFRIGKGLRVASLSFCVQTSVAFAIGPRRHARLLVPRSGLDDAPDRIFADGFGGAP